MIDAQHSRPVPSTCIPRENDDKLEDLELRGSQVSQHLSATPSSRSCAPFPCLSLFTGSLPALRVAKSPVIFLTPTLSQPPVSCAAGLDVNAERRKIATQCTGQTCWLDGVEVHSAASQEETGSRVLKKTLSNCGFCAWDTAHASSFAPAPATLGQSVHHIRPPASMLHERSSVPCGKR